MNKKDDKQASFDFDRPSKMAIKSQGPNLKVSESVIRVVFSNNAHADSGKPAPDVYTINRRILDLVK